MKLKQDMITRDGPIQVLDLKNYHEGIWVHKRNGLYYFSYPSYRGNMVANLMEYSVAKNPLGPFQAWRRTRWARFSTRGLSWITTREIFTGLSPNSKEDGGSFIMWPGRVHLSVVFVSPRFTTTRTATSYLFRSLIYVETHHPYLDRLHRTKPLLTIPDATVEPRAYRLCTVSAIKQGGKR